MSKYAAINEMLNRYNTGRLDLTDEEANLLAMQAQRLGKDFKVRSKPISKGFFDLADMATFGLVPDEWRPSSPGQEVFGESSADRFAGAIGSIGGLIGGVAGATKGAKMGWNALKKVFAKRKADNIATNLYKGNLLGPGPNVPQLGMGRPLGLPSRPLQLPGRPFTPGGSYYGTNPAQLTPKGMRNIGQIPNPKQARRMKSFDEEQLRSLDAFADPYGKGRYAQTPGTARYGANFENLSIGDKLRLSLGYQEGGEVMNKINRRKESDLLNTQTAAYMERAQQDAPAQRHSSNPYFRHMDRTSPQWEEANIAAQEAGYGPDIYRNPTMPNSPFSTGGEKYSSENIADQVEGTLRNEDPEFPGSGPDILSLTNMMDRYQRQNN